VADVMMELNGVRKRVPADRVAYFAGKGAKPVQEAPAAAPEPSMWERAREGVKGAGRSALEAAQGIANTGADAGSAALRGASLGLDDEIARLAARAGATVQRQREADDQMLSGGGESLLESWRATADLGDEALQERGASSFEWTHLRMDGESFVAQVLLTPIVFGDFSSYYVRNVKGIQVVRLNELYAANGQVGFMAFMRGDGALIDAGTHPVKGMVMAAS
jgi:hypothetical protein